MSEKIDMNKFFNKILSAIIADNILTDIEGIVEKNPVSGDCHHDAKVIYPKMIEEIMESVSRLRIF